ncbi:hypothetical protein GGI35DRAFT_484922 [Trichoderma velutinum]
MASLVSNKPAKKNSKWSTEENAIIIELRGRGMKWDEASKRLPGRSAISCRLHYQNYLERRSEWDEERKNKLARLYERFKSDMWAKVAEELAVPWRAAEAMHWQLGEADMARRAGVVPFSFATTNTSESPNSRTLTSQVRASRDLVNLDPVQPQIISAPQETTSSAPPTSYSRSQPISPMTSAQTPPQGHINSHSPPLQQPRRRGSRRPMQSTPRPSCEATPREPRSSPIVGDGNTDSEVDEAIAVAPGADEVREGAAAVTFRDVQAAVDREILAVAAADVEVSVSRSALVFTNDAPARQQHTVGECRGARNRAPTLKTLIESVEAEVNA